MISIESILLPKKEGPPSDSLGRVNAAAVLEDQKTPLQESTEPVKPAPLEPPQKNASEVKQLETYQSDIQDVIQRKNISTVTIAAAEEERRAKTGAPRKEPVTLSSVGKTFGLVVGGIILICAGIGLLVYFLTPHSVPIPTQPSSPVITVDETELVPISPTATPTQVVNTLTSARSGVSLSLGLIERLLITEATTTPNATPKAMDAPAFLSLVAPDVPNELLSTLQPQFLLGVHSYNQNQLFLILQVNSYEQAFAGMLAWESTMGQDLSPLFFLPQPVSPNPQATTSPTTPAPQVLNTPFVDGVIENHDARILEDSSGNIILFWTFLDSSTLVIANNDATLREIISRLSGSPITPTP